MSSAARRPRLLPLALAATLACGGGDGPPTGGATGTRTGAAAWFEEVADEAGVDFQHVRALGPTFYFPEISSGGGGWIDYDGDGDPDLYLVQGGDLDRAPGPPLTNALYRNDGGRFVDVTREAGVGDAGYGMGLAVGDLDGDGDDELYVSNLDANVLYRNDGDGTFTDVTAAAGVAEVAWTTSVAAADLELDGDRDLFLVNYVAWTKEGDVPCFGVGGARDYCGPNRYEAPAPDTLYRNDGDLTFTDVTRQAGLGAAFGNGLGVGVLDFEGDGLPDLYVANDLMPNQLWINRGDLRFGEEAVSRGCAVNMAGAVEAGMGVAMGDVDRDGRLDLLLTHLNQETNTLYMNRGAYCEDATDLAGLAVDSLARTGFGTVFADFDHDGWLDLWISNGKVALGRVGEDVPDPLAEPNLLYRGTGPARFEPVPATPGGPLSLVDNGRATAAADFDLDGDLDLVEVNNQGPARLFANRVGDGRPWLAVRPLDAAGAAEAAARVRLRHGGVERWATAERASSYCASQQPVAHFGLGGSEPVEEVLVVWPGGSKRAFRGVPAGRVLVAGHPAADPGRTTTTP